MFQRAPKQHSNGLSPSDNDRVTVVMQSLLTIVAAIIFSGLVFTGVLVFKDTDEADILARGDRLMVEGKVAKAIHQYEDLIQHYPRSYDGHIALGKAYLAMKKPKRAEKYFQLASKLPTGNNEKVDIHLAQAQLFLSQQSFEEGAQLLSESLSELPQPNEQLTAPATETTNSKKQRNDLVIAYIELHEQWADHLGQLENYEAAQEKYKAALDKVNNYAAESRLKEELIHNANQWASQLTEQNKNEQAVDVLKQALQYDYEAETLIRIAEIYKQGKDTDNAIVWYRKAYDAEPEQISLALSDLLISRGKELLTQGKRADADAYFDEADKLLGSGNTAPHLKYPITINDFNVSPGLNRASNSLQPSCKATIQNASHRSLPYLKVKASFWDNDTLLSEAEILPITTDTPLEPEGLASSKRTVSLRAKKPIHIDNLNGQAISIKLSVGYKEPHQPILWDLKSVQEIQLKTHENNPTDTETEETSNQTPRQKATSLPTTPPRKKPVFTFLQRPPEPRSNESSQ